MSENVEVYGKPNCVQCKFTVNELERLNIPYSYKHVSECLDTGGLTALPIVKAGEKRWGGFSPDKIRGLVETPKGMLNG